MDPFDTKRGVVDAENPWPKADKSILLGDRKLLRIVPGDVGGSFLYQKVADENLPLTLGAPMPLTVEAVTSAEAAVLERWILEGAQRN